MGSKHYVSVASRKGTIASLGTADTFDMLAKKQAAGWPGSKSLHSLPEQRERKRIKSIRSRDQRLAKKAARIEKDMEFRKGMTKGK